MKKIKSLTAAVLSLALLTGSLAVTAPEHISANAQLKYSTVMNNWDSRVANEMRLLPSGKYWNHKGRSTSGLSAAQLENLYSNYPCQSHMDTKNDNDCSTVIYHTGFPCNANHKKIEDKQCHGFAYKVAKDIWGTEDFYTFDTRSTPYTDPQVGDQVRLSFTVPGTTEAKHSIFITAISGDKITFADCNGELSDCKIRWGATKYYNSFVSKSGKKVGNGAQVTVDKAYLRKYTVEVARPYIKGDLNDDGKINSTDVDIFKKTYIDNGSTSYKKGDWSETYIHYALFDVNGDSRLTEDDFTLLKRIASGYSYDKCIARCSDTINYYDRVAVPNGCFVYNRGIYKIVNGTAVFIKPFFTEEVSYVINSSVMYNNRSYTVTQIGDPSSNRPGGNQFNKLKSIVIPSSVTKINKYAFANSNISSIVFNGSTSNLNTVEEGAFYLCANMETFNFKTCSKLTFIGRNAFYGCNNSSSSGITLQLANKKVCYGSTTTRLGDANGDGKVNLTDKSLVVDYLSMMNPSINLEVLDLDFNGIVDLKDLSLLSNYMD